MARRGVTGDADGAGAGFVIDGAGFSAPALAPGLYIVATPIGNLADITVRALQVLSAADVIACEDTRHTARLLGHYSIATPRVSYHEHNAARRRPELLSRLADGGRVALVSDAGTPLVSDPGYRLVSEAVAAGHAVVPIPGASAMLAALVAAGLPTDAFYFAGFLPPKSAQRARRIAALKDIPGTLVIYESAPRIAACLKALAEGLGDRPAAIARELTKRFETVTHGSLSELSRQIAEAGPPKGEIVVLVAPPQCEETPDIADLDERLGALIAELGVSRAAQQLARQTGLARKALYERALTLKQDGE